MNDRQLTYLLTILKEGSISKAADVLCISQPSLSQMVRKIEKEIHADIFFRHQTPIALTAAGECYIQAAQNILNIQQAMTDQIHEINTGARGTIRVGVPLQRAMEILPVFFPVYHKKYPNVELRFEERGSDQLENMLLENGLDLAFVTTAPKINDLRYLPVADEKTVLLASKQAAIASRIPAFTPISIREAKDEQFIAIKRGHSVRNTQDQLFAANNIKPEILFETSSIEVAKRSVPSCGAVMLCPKNYIDMSPELYETCQVYPVTGIEVERHFFIILRKNKYMNRYMQDLVDMFIELYRHRKVRTA